VRDAEASSVGKVNPEGSEGSCVKSFANPLNLHASEPTAENGPRKKGVATLERTLQGPERRRKHGEWVGLM